MSGGKQKVGRPRKNYDHEIRKQYGRSEVVSILDGPRSRDGIQVKARCLDCGKEYETRLRRLKAGETRTCGCLKARNYLNYIGRRVARLGPEAVAGIWTDRFSGSSRQATAGKFKVTAGVVDEAQRQYQARLECLIEDETTSRKLELIAASAQPTARATQEFGLARQAALYLIAATKNRMKAAEGELAYKLYEVDGLSTWAAEVLERVRERSNRWRLDGVYRWELTAAEFKMRKGHILGELAPLYQGCKAADLTVADENQAAIISTFVEMAENTLQNRRARQLAAIRKNSAELREAA
jgi:hypothetical protein